MSFAQIIQQHGEAYAYAVTFVWTALEGETFVIFGGYFAQKGWLNPYLLFIAAWLGSLVGDQFFFYLGRRYGLKIVDKFPKFKPKLGRALGWIERHPIPYILVYRFMYGLRNVSGVALGISQVPWRIFSFWNAIASAVWAATFVGAGVIFGKIIARMGAHKETALSDLVHQATFGVLLVFIVILVAKKGTEYLLNRYKEKKAARQQSSPSS